MLSNSALKFPRTHRQNKFIYVRNYKATDDQLKMERQYYADALANACAQEDWNYCGNSDEFKNLPTDKKHAGWWCEFIEDGAGPLTPQLHGLYMHYKAICDIDNDCNDIMRIVRVPKILVQAALLNIK
jgi:hypothetical protein